MAEERRVEEEERRVEEEERRGMEEERRVEERTRRAKSAAHTAAGGGGIPAVSSEEDAALARAIHFSQLDGLWLSDQAMGTAAGALLFDMMINPRSNTCVLSYTL